MLDLGLKGKSVLVAGAGHRPPRPGIGRAAALAMCEAGARVACVDIDPERGRAVADELKALGGESIAIAADLRDRAQVAAAVSQVVEEFGRLDVCVDIIGEARWDTVLDFTDEDWDWTMQTNLRQVFLIFQAAANQMVSQGTGGALVAVSSVDGISSAAYHVAYGAAKAGLISMVKTFAEELGPMGVRINAVAPGMVWSPTADQPEPPPGDSVTPLRRPSAEDIARALTFFASELAHAVSGQTLAVDGAASVKGEWGFTREMVDMVKGVSG